MTTRSFSRQQRRIPVTAREGVVANVFVPDAPAHGLVVVHPATATPQGFYRGFAEHAAGRGLVAVTYDYRGTGLSGGARELRNVRMRDWLQQDIPAVACWAAAEYPHLTQHGIGHSVGGHGLVLDYGTDALASAIIVSSHLVALRSIMPWTERLRVITVLKVIGPVLSFLLGYMPGRKLGLGEDIPAAAMFDWGRWMRMPGYFLDDPEMQAAERMAQMRVPLLAIGASDDKWATVNQMDALTAHCTATQVECRTITPQQLAVNSLGHHGLMRRNVAEPVWVELVNWMLARR